jgi:hypothetical protein
VTSNFPLIPTKSKLAELGISGEEENPREVELTLAEKELLAKWRKSHSKKLKRKRASSSRSNSLEEEDSIPES